MPYCTDSQPDPIYTDTYTVFLQRSRTYVMLAWYTHSILQHNREGTGAREIVFRKRPHAPILEHPTPSLSAHHCLPELLRIQPQPRREPKTLAHCQNVDGSEDLMHHLHIAPGPNTPLDNKQLRRRGHLLEQEPPLLKRRVRCARHDRQRPVRRADRASRHRRIHEVHIAAPTLPEFPLHPLRVRARHSRAQVQRGALRQALEDAAGAENGVLRLLRRRHHAHVEGLVFGRLAQRTRRRAACRRELLQRRRPHVEPRHWVPGFDQVRGHAEAHGSEAAETDGGLGRHCGSVVFWDVLRWWWVSSASLVSGVVSSSYV